MTDEVNNFPYWNKQKGELLDYYNASLSGLTTSDAEIRLKKYGTNELARKQKRVLILGFLVKFFNPLTIILLAATLISLLLDQRADFFIILIILAISATIDFIQEYQAEDATDKLRRKVALTVEVTRDGVVKEILSSRLVPGDIINLDFGDMVPADARLLESENLLVDESSLTGESFPSKKTADILKTDTFQVAKMNNCVFMGTNVVLGRGIALVVAVGEKTQIGSISSSLVQKRPSTDFEKGIQNFSLMITKITAVLIVIMFLANLLLQHNFLTSLMFAVAIAIGLVPELLPMIITINLSKGAVNLSKKGVIVKNLPSIQNFGSMEILCTDKTGTLTKGEISLSSYEDINEEKSPKLAKYSYFESVHQSGRSNPMAQAICTYFANTDVKDLKKIIEIPFDFFRRRSSIVAEESSKRLIICQGSPESVSPLCVSYEKSGEIKDMSERTRSDIMDKFNKLSAGRTRMIALGYKKIENKENYTESDEKNLTFLGFISFKDPVKEGVKEAIDRLKALKIELKILTGDNELVTKNVCGEIGLSTETVLTGDQLDKLSDEELLSRLPACSIFARLNPKQKERIILLLKKSGKVVGFLGDGINDAQSLRVADIGISVNNAQDIAKDAADLILLKKDLSVLRDGVEEGRKTFANIIKYIKLGTSSDFGNMFSMAAASLFLPFLPMLPVQILLNDLLYDATQLAIPSDNVDKDELENPESWNISQVKKFMFLFGPISSIFDFITFGILLFIFKGSPSFFQTGWFVESIVSQSLIVLSIRTKKFPFFKSKPSKPLLFVILAIVSFAMVLPFTPLGTYLYFSPLKPLFYILLLIITISYFASVELVKSKLISTWKVSLNRV